MLSWRLSFLYFCKEPETRQMKTRNILIAGLFLLWLGAIPSCDIIEECATCVLITEDEDGNVISETTPVPFCGEDLAEKENSTPVTVGGSTSYWVCN